MSSLLIKVFFVLQVLKAHDLSEFDDSKHNKKKKYADVSLKRDKTPPCRAKALKTSCDFICDHKFVRFLFLLLEIVTLK